MDTFDKVYILSVLAISIGLFFLNPYASLAFMMLIAVIEIIRA